MDTDDASSQHDPAQPASPLPAPSPRLRRRAVRIAAAQTRVAARRGVRLWRSPLAAPARRSSQALAERVGAQAARLQPVAIEALRRGVDKTLASPLPESLAAALVEHDVPERIAAVLLKGDTLEHVLDVAEREDMVKRLLEHSLTRRFAMELGASEHIGHILAAIMPGEHRQDEASAQSASPDRATTEGVGGADGVVERLARAIFPGPDQPAATGEEPAAGGR